MTRLFDYFERNAREYPEDVAFGKKEGGIWKKIMYKDANLQIENLASSILKLIGFPSSYTPESQEKICLISNNRPEWIITDCAIQQAGAIITPVYPTVGLPDLEYILQESDVKIVFVSNQEIYDRFKPVIQNSKYKVFAFDKIDGVENWESLLVQPSSEADLQKSKANITSDTIATIIYTSGTTGNPKGVMLSHKNVVTNVESCYDIFHFADRGDKTLSFLPLNHIFEKMVTYVYIKKGAQIFYAENMETIGDNLKEVQPTVFTCVPRVLEKVYAKIVNKGKELTGIKKALFFWALKLAQRYDNHTNMGAWYNFQLKLANKIIFSKWREALGNNVKAVISGAAALNPDLIRIFTAANIIVMEGYGLTETSPVISVNTFNNNNRYIGTVGPVIKNVQVKLEPDGEILVKADSVMEGYYKNPAGTKEVMTEDGWFRTGDIGTFEHGKYLKITDRKKEMFKTSGGKYVAPQNVENIYRTVDSISQIMLIGDGRNFVSALIVPDWDVVAAKLNNGTSISINERKEWINNPALINLIQKGIDWANPKINHIEQVKKFALVPEEWSVDNKMLTPKFSLKRKIIELTYADQIKKMYEA